MRLRSFIGLLVCFFFSSRPLPAENWEKITALSPDKKFAMRVTCDGKPEDPEHIEASSVKAIEIVSLPQKEVVGSLSVGEYGSFSLIWSVDSKWCAFYSMSGPRVGDTYIYRWRDNKFVRLETDELSVPINGDVRNQYVEPVRWLKPGTLVLKQEVIFRGDDARDSTIEFTVRFDESGKFRVISKRKKR